MSEMTDLSSSSRDMQRPTFDEHDDVFHEIPHTTTTEAECPSEAFAALAASPLPLLSPHGLFCPKPTIDLGDDSPDLGRDLSVRDLPPGSKVWVGNTEDVKRVLRIYWLKEMDVVTSWKLQGSVVRHSGSHTLVAFHEGTLYLTFPRALLYREKLEGKS